MATTTTTETTTETFRPNSRNTCPYPGCDEPKGEGFGGTCEAHETGRRF